MSMTCRQRISAMIQFNMDKARAFADNSELRARYLERASILSAQLQGF